MFECRSWDGSLKLCPHIPDEIRGTPAGLFFPGKRGSAGAHHYTRLEEEFLENLKAGASAEGYDMADRSFSLLRREWASSRTHAQRRRRSENKAWQIHR